MLVCMGRLRVLVAVLLGLMISCVQADLAQARLRVGVTLHPYYSFVKNIVGDKADVVPISNDVATRARLGMNFIFCPRWV